MSRRLLACQSTQSLGQLQAVLNSSPDRAASPRGLSLPFPEAALQQFLKTLLDPWPK